jgi:hypothetical protein
LKNPNAAAAEEAVDMSNMSAAEKKKAKLLARKAKAKQEAGAKAKAAEASAAAAENDNDDKKKCKFPDPVAPPADKDPLGHEYLASCDPLPAAAKLVSALVKFSPKAISTHVCAFDVACRRMKPLQALQALCRGSKISASSPEMILRIAAFALGVECSGLSKSKKTDIPPCPTNASDELKQAWVCAVAVSQACASLESYAVEALLLELSSLIGGATPTDWLASVAATGAASSLPIGIAVARGSLLLAKFPGANSKAMKVAAVKALLGGGLDRADAKYSVCEEAMKVLQDAEADTTEWKAMCAKRFPISEAFGTVLRPVMGVHEPPDVLE